MPAQCDVLAHVFDERSEVWLCVGVLLFCAQILQHLPPLEEAKSSGLLRRLKSYRLQDNDRYCRLAKECVIGSLEDRMQIDQLFP